VAQEVDASHPRRAIVTPDAPAAIGPYSQAIVAGGWVFVSGQIPMDPATSQMVNGDISAQTTRVLTNIQAILEAAGSSWAAVVKSTVYLRSLDDFAAMNAVYATFAGTPAPARATVQVSRLPRDVQIEVDVIALA
jgi:2-iminobutanoate/2-iminopropanoate deaminase